ncbi:cef modifier of supressor tRNAs [Escherichia phage EcS1]|uniref:Modifier of suppressor tRNAs n=1 Tax=Escherichia phage EcS1 TaxID=2083276 RepID=A0A2Z5ZBV9_9CAUD|nr:cef modifier of supressor tRNAs [Escherichia phage EcS1]BBC78060.1 Modifier of suppressor tRNAs [Escherichia phage EcS1]
MSKQPLTQDQFEDILYSPILSVVQKEVTSGLEHHSYAYVYEGDLAIYVAVRHITAKGTTYWKEAI